VLDRFPNINVYITHAGGFVPYQLGRLVEHFETLAYDAVNELPLIEYVPRFYFDPMIHETVTRRALVERLGVERFVYGSNFSGSDQIDFDLTDDIGLSESEREAIKSGNAIDLLNLQDRLAVNS
jgi:aminocarboxymuconate-semialdehyde decarboxylase